MTLFDQTRLESLGNAFRSTRIAVIGDLMLDRYTFGSVARISPEAPVPVLDVTTEQARLGGAANVGHNILGLGATPLMLGVVGDDPSGILLKGIFRELGFPLDGIVTDSVRPTTVKTRIIAGSQHMLRLDQEQKQPISDETQESLLNILVEQIETIDAVILEDYNKGVLTPHVIHEATRICREHNVPVFVDPKFQNFFEYQSCTLFKPNRKEVEDAMGRLVRTDEEITEAGNELLDRLGASHVLLTLGERGMLLFSADASEQFSIPTRARQVADVSGAGDTVIATMAVATACGTTVQEAAVMANRAAGLVVEELGIVPIYREQLIAALLEDAMSTL